MAQNNFDGLSEALKEKEVQAYAEQPLIVNTPSILGFTKFIENLIWDAI